MIRRLLPIVTLVVFSGSGIALSQPPSRGSDSRGDFFSRLDTNRNGSLEPSEVDGRMKSLIERAAQRVGLDPSQPMPLDKLRGSRSDGSSSRSSSTAGTGGSSTSGSKTAALLVPGFGLPADQSQAFSFGSPQAPATQQRGGPAEERSSRGDWRSERSRDSDRDRGDRDRGDRDRGDRDRSGGGEDERERAERLRRFAEGMLRQYDANKNGRLEKEEWKNMRGDPENSDTNKDGIITQEELAERLSSYSRGSRGDDRSGSRGGDSRSTESSASPRRFLTPAERLPKDIPSWFTSSDRDGDGQIMMHEFAPTWSEIKALEFAKKDLNGDGVITPKETLEAEAASKKTSSSSDRQRR